MVEHNLLCIAEMNLTRDDVGLSMMPLYHCAELHCNLFARVHRGAANVIHHEFEPEAVLEAIEDRDVTVLFAAPTAWNALSMTAAEMDVDLSSLRLGLYGAAPMPEQVLENCMKHLCEVRPGLRNDRDRAGRDLPVGSRSARNRARPDCLDSITNCASSNLTRTRTRWSSGARSARY